MPMTDADKANAVELVCNHWQCRWAITRDRERIGRLAEAVWAYCDSQPNFVERLAMDRDSTIAGIQLYLKSQTGYADLVSFIPFVFIFLIKVIISILVDYWLLNKKV